MTPEPTATRVAEQPVTQNTDRFFGIAIDLTCPLGYNGYFKRLNLPICSYGKSVRDDQDYWHTVESYLAQHTSSRLTHSICPSCMESQVEPQFNK